MNEVIKKKSEGGEQRLEVRQHKIQGGAPQTEPEADTGHRRTLRQNTKHGKKNLINRKFKYTME